MTESFDRDKFTGQVHVWIQPVSFTTNGIRKTTYRVCVARRNTDPELHDDDIWGNWIDVQGDDAKDVGVKLLFFAECMGYQVVIEPESHIDFSDEGDSARHKMACGIYNEYCKQRDSIKDITDTVTDSSSMLSTLFNDFADLHNMQAEYLRMGPGTV